MKMIYKLCCVLIPVFLLCSCLASPKAFTLEKINLSRSEKELVSLLGSKNVSGIFRYKVDDQVKSVNLNVYTLDEKLNWKLNSGFQTKIEKPTGKIAVIVENRNLYRLTSLNNDNLSEYELTPIYETNLTKKSSSISFADQYNIEYDKEIPLLLKVETASDILYTTGVDAFYNPAQRLKDYDHVVAVTATFTTTEK